MPVDGPASSIFSSISIISSTLVVIPVPTSPTVSPTGWFLDHELIRYGGITYHRHGFCDKNDEEANKKPPGEEDQPLKKSANARVNTKSAILNLGRVPMLHFAVKSEFSELVRVGSSGRAVVLDRLRGILLLTSICRATSGIRTQ
ncbi:hypothetical protein M5K25_007690 [Dendrobium thyrsiflorum]|uniref:Uncharacterized protein n=1 Tax=Dendrobium thyrsiflorum TaxID=117978 RepID=A0ABD0VG82_DENTH